MKNNSKIGQELSELKPVELVGYEDEEAGNPDDLASWVVHRPALFLILRINSVEFEAIRYEYGSNQL